MASEKGKNITIYTLTRSQQDPATFHSSVHWGARGYGLTLTNQNAFAFSRV